MDILLSPSAETTPYRKISAMTNLDTEVIVWDDPPSSPFETEVRETCQQNSRDWKKTTDNRDHDSVFEDTRHTLAGQEENAPEDIITDFEEKENEAPTIDFDIDIDLDTPQKPQMQSIPSTAVREKDLSSMPPPSTTRRTAAVSPSKRNHNAQTPLHTKSARAMPMSARSTTHRDMPSSMDDSMFNPDETNIDDTCFSTFSAVPDMTVFAKLGERSPFKNQQTPRAPGNFTPQSARTHRASSRSASPTPRRNRSPVKDGNTTSLLIDFTQQMDSFTAGSHHNMPSAQNGLSPSRTEPNLLSYLTNQRSPNKGRMSTVSPSKQSNLLNLLDFELPPPPTPRSTPSFSVREVESMKSAFQSQISSIKAKLSGKEAEVDSLKKALEDAERRVGEAQEATRDEKAKREQAEQEKADWEKRGLDVENVLQSVKEEVLKSEVEKEALEIRAEEGERRIADAEARCLDMQARLASLPVGENGEGGINGEEIQRLVQAQLDSKIESVSRELHAVYKKKHETKVATLKKSYEARSEKKSLELQTLVEELTRQNEHLTTAKEATFSGELPTGNVSQNEYMQVRRAADKYRAEAEEQAAKLAGLDQEIHAMQQEQNRILGELERERAEKGDLVAAVDEMLMLQSSDAPPAVIEDFKKSISRSSGFSGLKPPGGMTSSMPESRIGRGIPSGLSRPSANKSRMMTSIERMGNGRQ